MWFTNFYQTALSLIKKSDVLCQFLCQPDQNREGADIRPLS